MPVDVETTEDYLEFYLISSDKMDFQKDKIITILEIGSDYETAFQNFNKIVFKKQKYHGREVKLGKYSTLISILKRTSVIELDYIFKVRYHEKPVGSTFRPNHKYYGEFRAKAIHVQPDPKGCIVTYRGTKQQIEELRKSTLASAGPLIEGFPDRKSIVQDITLSKLDLNAEDICPSCGSTDILVQTVIGGYTKIECKVCGAKVKDSWRDKK